MKKQRENNIEKKNVLTVKGLKEDIKNNLNSCYLLFIPQTRGFYWH